MLASSEACQQTLHSLTRSHCKLKETNPRARSWSHHVFFVLSLGTLICAPSRERRKHVSDHLIVSTGFMAGGTFLLAGIIKMPSYGQQWIRSLEPAIFPEVINLGRIVKKKRKRAAKRPLERHSSSTDITFPIITILNSIACKQLGIVKEMSCGRLNASWKISSSAVDGQSFLVIDGSLLN